ncbi:four helix bundle suffix domain-containing protein [Patescibacteria group bacterium]
MRNQGKHKNISEKNRGNMGTNRKLRAGYEYLLAYKITVPIYDYTVEFCDRWINKYSRTRDQMIQAARSGTQNLAEGYKQQGLKGYIKLSGVNRGSLEELLKDYLSFARQKKLTIWPKENAKKIKEIRVIWEIIKKHPILPDSPNFPNFPDNPEVAVNIMVTLINQANYLQDKLIASLKEKHKTQGGLTEELYRTRKEYRGY